MRVDHTWGERRAGQRGLRLTQAAFGGLQMGRSSWIGNRIRQAREHGGLSQGDIERSTGLLRAYISRVEHGHTVPSVENLERFAAALHIPLHELVRGGQVPAEDARDGPAERFLRLLGVHVAGLTANDRELLLNLGERLAKQNSTG
jgi:transcriptional regulator with XRE-family HTH domain